MSSEQKRQTSDNGEAIQQYVDDQEAQIAEDLDQVVGESDVTLDTLSEQLAESRKRELQAQAELENFRKRILRDTEQQLRFAAMPLLRDLLDVVDNLHRAREAAAGNAGSGNALLEGVTLVQQQLLEILRKHNCTRIESVGQPFDPNYHEAISQMPSEEHPAGHVALEAAAGYKLYDRVVRPAQVLVSTGPAA